MSYQDVSVAVVRNSEGKILIAKRPMHVSSAGLWEFPGGKRLIHESFEACLARECLEEIGITVSASRPLLNIPYDYEDQKVKLHVYLVLRYTGDAFGAEGQEVAWVDLSELHQFRFPAANQQIIDHLLKELSPEVA